jgi:hypothetical protein
MGFSLEVGCESVAYQPAFRAVEWYEIREGNAREVSASGMV